MTPSPTESPRPIADRARDWVFRLYYAHLLTGEPGDVLVGYTRAIFVMEDDEWDSYHGLSPYVPDPRSGRVATTVWERNVSEIERVLAGMLTRREPIEAAIQTASPRWRIDRMPLVDRSLLTLGTEELVHRGARPVKRVINRTVELAKRYGEAESRRFVNGILDQIRKNHEIAVE